METAGKRSLLRSPPRNSYSSNYSSDAEAVLSNTVSVRQLSSFPPTEHNVLEDTEEEWTLRLGEHDVGSFLNATTT